MFVAGTTCNSPTRARPGICAKSTTRGWDSDDTHLLQVCFVIWGINLNICPINKRLWVRYPTTRSRWNVLILPRLTKYSSVSFVCQDLHGALSHYWNIWGKTLEANWKRDGKPTKKSWALIFNALIISIFFK